MDIRDWETALTTAWRRVRERVEGHRDLAFGHEHTLQFHFPWEVARVFNYDDALSVRFESLCGRDEYGETIRLDLLFWTDPKHKFAVERRHPRAPKAGAIQR